MSSANPTSQIIPILLNLIAAIIGALGQLLYKRGSLLISSTPIWNNFSLIGGCLSFCGVMVLFVMSYRLGGKVSISYPFYATTFIWSTGMASFFLHELITPLQWVGIILITVGIVAVAAGQNIS